MERMPTGTATQGANSVITFELSNGVLGHLRFALPPLSEVTLSVRLLGAPRSAHVHLPWVRHIQARPLG